MKEKILKITQCILKASTSTILPSYWSTYRVCEDNSPSKLQPLNLLHASQWGISTKIHCHLTSASVLQLTKCAACHWIRCCQLQLTQQNSTNTSRTLMGLQPAPRLLIHDWCCPGTMGRAPIHAQGGAPKTVTGMSHLNSWEYQIRSHLLKGHSQKHCRIRHRSQHIYCKLTGQ